MSQQEQQQTPNSWRNIIETLLNADDDTGMEEVKVTEDLQALKERLMKELANKDEELQKIKEQEKVKAELERALTAAKERSRALRESMAKKEKEMQKIEEEITNLKANGAKF